MSVLLESEARLAFTAITASDVWCGFAERHPNPALKGFSFLALCSPNQRKGTESLYTWTSGSFLLPNPSSGITIPSDRIPGLAFLLLLRTASSSLSPGNLIPNAKDCSLPFVPIDSRFLFAAKIIDARKFNRQKKWTRRLHDRRIRTHDQGK